MRHPDFFKFGVFSKFRVRTSRKITCITLAAASILVFGATVRPQSFDQFTIKSDRKRPLATPQKKPSPADTPSKKSESAPEEAIFAPLSGCVYNDILVLDTIRIVFVRLFNFPENSAIPVTVTQTNAGVVGYALTPAGPFVPSLNIVVNTDSNGNGQSEPVYTQGQLVGTTVTYGDTPYGPTDTINFNVLPQCNCPPIPIVP